jgi:farnesyl-diphosphate farnesyltransferase
MNANDNKIQKSTPLAASTPAAAVEIWSGKDKADENFPVGSFLIARHLRPHVHAFYAFARNADDIADDVSLPPAEKIARLNVMEAVLTGTRPDDSPSASRLKLSLEQSGVSNIHARELLIAFRQDAEKNRYANWAELLDYCRYSAAPVGRYMLDLHGEAATTWPASDALCAALQILNHLQDAAGDLRSLDRCYLPQDALETAGTSTDDLARPEMIPALRHVYDDLLTATAKLNTTAATLPGQVVSRRLRVETAIIAKLAQRLTAKLRHGDPLATRVKLQKTDFFLATITSLGRLI